MADNSSIENLTVEGMPFENYDEEFIAAKHPLKSFAPPTPADIAALTDKVIVPNGTPLNIPIKNMHTQVEMMGNSSTYSSTDFPPIPNNALTDEDNADIEAAIPKMVVIAPEPVIHKKLTSYRLNALVNMLAMGMRGVDVAIRLNMSQGRVSVLARHPDIQKAIADRQKEMFSKDPTAYFRSMAPRAARALNKIIKDPGAKDSAKVTAATAILDRAYGKPKQEVEHDAGNIMDLFKALDGMKGQEKTISAVYSPIDQKIEEAEFEEKKDPVDSWVESMEVNAKLGKKVGKDGKLG